jgi:hypothetical protein
LAGCATHAKRVRTARELFYAGDAAGAAAQLEQQLSSYRSDRDVVALDMATAKLFAGQPQQAEQTLREVRDRFDYLEQDNVAESAFSMLTDDTRRAYAGEDYEKVLIRVMLALTNLAGDGQDAAAYCLQVNDKQQQIMEAGVAADGENPKLAYQRVAVGAYLYGAMREATHGNYDDVQRSFAQVASWQPEFAARNQDLLRAQQGVHSARGNGVLYVFAFVGRGPYKEEVSEVPSSHAMLIADRILSATADHSVPPTLAPIKVPQVVLSHNDLDQVFVAINQQPAGATSTITDVSQLAVAQYEAVFPYVMARAVARRAIKKAAIYSAKSGMETDGWVELAMDGVGVVWEALESADTRCWSLLPDTIQVARFELPAGEHLVSLMPAARGRAIAAPTALTVRIEDGRNTYAMACFPTARLAGQVLVSGSL